MPSTPNGLITEAQLHLMRNEAPGAEALGRLTDAQVDEVQREGWFRLFVPPTLNGKGLDLPSAVRLEEDLAFADGSLGWVVTLCAGAGLFAGYFDPVFAGEVFTSPKVCLAGSGQVGGTAVPEHDGFRISGSWPHASGAAHATHLTANCRIEGSGAVRSFLFLREEVSLFSNWETIGLKATGSHGYSVNGLWVPAHRCFEIEAKAARWKEPVYRFPFLPFAEATLAVNFSGMSLHFLEEAEALIHAKQPYDEHSTAAQAAALALLFDLREEVQALRHHFYRALDGAWQAHVVGLPSRDLEALSKWSRALAQGARSAVDTLYPFCGLEAARPDTTINRIWRDLHTASQHALLR